MKLRGQAVAGDRFKFGSQDRARNALAADEDLEEVRLIHLASKPGAIPVKFSLGDDQGLAIFATGFPKSEQIACSSAAEVDGIESTVTAGSSSLSYDAATDQYAFVWKTDKGWTGTCRQLVVKLNDGTAHRANFKFK